LIYSFHLANGWSPLVKPFMDNHLHGVFAARAPNRPNPIGLSVVALESIEPNRLYI
jgi:tRNA-Thr(GGU) m(6)t(6)A37 methyltransferase TsaA